jgi:hypothetical protein
VAQLGAERVAQEALGAAWAHRAAVGGALAVDKKRRRRRLEREQGRDEAAGEGQPAHPPGSSRGEGEQGLGLLDVLGVARGQEGLAPAAARAAAIPGPDRDAGQILGAEAEGARGASAARRRPPRESSTMASSASSGPYRTASTSRSPTRRATGTPPSSRSAWAAGPWRRSSATRARSARAGAKAGMSGRRSGRRRSRSLLGTSWRRPRGSTRQRPLTHGIGGGQRALDGLPGGVNLQRRHTTNGPLGRGGEVVAEGLEAPGVGPQIFPSGAELVLVQGHAEGGHRVGPRQAELGVEQAEQALKVLLRSPMVCSIWSPSRRRRPQA